MLYNDLMRLRRRVARDVKRYRYRDMAFRIFRNDALQKYRPIFDLTALYIYLAAKAYDYETCLWGGQNYAGQEFLERVVRERTLGKIIDGKPEEGAGLAGCIKEMYNAWAGPGGFKKRLGFNNPQIETNKFSLRWELWRIGRGSDEDEKWREKLSECVYEHLSDVPEYRVFCRPVQNETCPAIVVRFGSTIAGDLNFFGVPSATNDSSYNETYYATKIRAVGLWFSDYARAGLTRTPRIWFIPAGKDISRYPSPGSFQTREWTIITQDIPIPNTLTQVPTERSWIPLADSLREPFFGYRRKLISTFKAFHEASQEPNSQEITSDTQLVCRSVWNTRWTLIIPGTTLYGVDPQEGIKRFIFGKTDSHGQRTGRGVSDIKFIFKTHAYRGLK
ncbi:MAG: hypothetical protein JRJ29_20655 [Deltaproteobacteria bacterium]|nr:hypothetical protein [Deltaproteobacteria bacterium]